MSRAMHIETPEFYMLRDDRSEGERMSDINLYDEDPARTKWLADQYDARTKTRYPDWVPGTQRPSMVEGEHTVRFRSSELPSSTCFRRKAPRKISHYEIVPVLGFSISGSWPIMFPYCVSPEWAEAIQKFEPGIHEFHPFKLKYKDGIEFKRFLFRGMQVGPVIDFERSEYKDERELYLPIDRGKKITLRSKIVWGKDWISQWRPGGGKNSLHFVSARLAEQFRPLLPPAVLLKPVVLR
jgi:hypothetical protein